MEDDPSSLQSIFHVRASELYPKQSLLKEDESLTLPFTPLCGEAIEYLGQSTEGVLALSNYRFYHQLNDKETYYNIPLGLIEHVEVKDLTCLQISCKDARTCRCSFSTSETCWDWLKRIVKAIAPPKNKDEVFAYAYFAWAGEELGDEMPNRLGKELHGSTDNAFRSEVERLKFDVQSGGLWRISSANIDHRLCPTYPHYLLTPASISDKILESVAKFRSSRRVPAVVWRHRTNGAVIARCSQPEVGWLGWRSAEDEDLLKAITDACIKSAAPECRNLEKKLLIMDARSYTTAVANRARGGGCECPEYYPNCEIKFMNLANIHSIRKSFNALQALCAMPPDQAGWFISLDSTKWLHNMSGLFHAAVTVASAIEEHGRPVLVHCSDGWDRTPQIISLAQLLLDPYYRTIEGFQVLVEREWLEFGHKFTDRCGLSDDVNERCPVFLQWLDCIQNLLKRFPCAFEFSVGYLVKLAQHTYSNLFGTFLCNSSAERSKLGVQQRTFSVWRFLQSPNFRNHLYSSSQDQVLWPYCNVRDLEVWRELYLGYSSNEPQTISTTICLASTNVLKTPSTLWKDGSLKVLGVDCVEDGQEFPIGTSAAIFAFSAMKISEEQGFENLIGREETTNGADVEDSVIDGSVDRSPCESRSDDNSSVEKDSAIGGMYNNCDKTTDVSADKAVTAWMENGVVYFDSDVEDSEQKYDTRNKSGHSSTDTIVPENGIIDDGGDKRTQSVSPIPLSSTGGRLVLPLLLDPVDGLAPLRDDVQTRLQQMALEHKAKEVALERELHTTRLTLLQKFRHQCTHTNPLEQQPQDDEQGSLCSTEVSWEAVEEPRTTLWVPDHAVSHCTGCKNQFWLGRRKHHCRSCGKIFCADCSENVVALPEEQLYEPVRVCGSCYNNPLSSKIQTCKQQAGQVRNSNSPSDSQGTGVIVPLPPTHI